MLSLITSLACNQCTIPFCRKRMALNRKGGHKPSKQVLTRENRIAKRNLRLARAGTGGDAARSFLPALSRCSRPSPPALASPRFRLAGLRVALTLWRWGSVFARRPDGLRKTRVTYPPVLPSPADLTACQHPRPQQRDIIPNANQPVRAEGLGSDAGIRTFFAGR